MTEPTTHAARAAEAEGAAAGWTSRVVAQLGGLVAMPLRTFRSLVPNDHAAVFAAVSVYGVVLAVIHAPALYRLLVLAPLAGDVVLRRVLDVFAQAGRSDVAVTLGAAVVVALVARVREQPGRSAAAATVMLLVPLAVLKAIGGALAALGLDLWWLPHHAVDSIVVVKAGRVDVVRFVTKCVFAYGPGLGVLLAWIGRPTTRRPGRTDNRLDSLRILAGQAVLGAALLALVAATLADLSARREKLRPVLPGDPLPALSLKRLDAPGRFDPATLRGSVVVIDFWASWCPPCRRSMPELSALQKELAPRGLVVLGVSRDTSLKEAKKALSALAPAFSNFIDDNGTGEVLGLTSLPSTWIVGRDGIVRHVHLGYTDPAVFRREIEAQLSATGGS